MLGLGAGQSIRLC